MANRAKMPVSLFHRDHMPTANSVAPAKAIQGTGNSESSSARLSPVLWMVQDMEFPPRATPGNLPRRTSRGAMFKRRLTELAASEPRPRRAGVRPDSMAPMMTGNCAPMMSVPLKCHRDTRRFAPARSQRLRREGVPRKHTNRSKQMMLRRMIRLCGRSTRDSSTCSR